MPPFLLFTLVPCLPRLVLKMRHGTKQANPAFIQSIGFYGATIKCLSIIYRLCFSLTVIIYLLTASIRARFPEQSLGFNLIISKLSTFSFKRILIVYTKIEKTRYKYEKPHLHSLVSHDQEYIHASRNFK